MLYSIFRTIITFIFKIAFKLRFEGTENLPENGGTVYASNHRSYADPIFISLKIKKRCTYMAKEELFKNPFFSLLIRAFGAFPVERGKGDMSVIDNSISKLQSGKNLVIFPEGTRSKDGKVGNGKTGVALIAAKSNAEVIPVAIVYDGKLSFRKKVTVKYGTPISSEELRISDPPVPRELKQLKHTIMGSITELVENEKNEYKCS